MVPVRTSLKSALPIYLISLSAFLPAWLATAQEVSQHPVQLELSGGPFLPSRIPNVTEVLKGIDLRASFMTAKGWFEIDGYLAQGEGTVYRAASLDYRVDLANDVFPAFVLLGLNADFFQTSDSIEHFAAGWNFGGGCFQPLTHSLSLREDFRYRAGPGRSLMVLLGLSVTIN